MAFMQLPPPNARTSAPGNLKTILAQYIEKA
jgi:hypothetical protein